MARLLKLHWPWLVSATVSVGATLIAMGFGYRGLTAQIAQLTFDCRNLQAAQAAQFAFQIESKSDRVGINVKLDAMNSTLQDLIKIHTKP
jgi:hypothetical protein